MVRMSEPLAPVAPATCGQTPGAARRIASDVWCLGPRGRTQTNVYLVAGGSSWTLIDAGWAGDAPAIRHAADEVFGPGRSPTSILLTHVHPDHAGAARELAHAWGCSVLIPAEELAIARGEFEAMTVGAGPLDTWVVLPMLRAIGRRRREALIARSRFGDVARATDPAVPLPGLPGWQVIATPGHTAGHRSFFRADDRVVISGDAIVNLQLNSAVGFLRGHQGLSGPPWYTTWNPGLARASIAALAALEPRVLAPGHGRPLVGPETPAALHRFAARMHPGGR
jgi:glyoxylase-like metal-dependent hydrolase (beta-lactamase superfamily II)